MCPRSNANRPTSSTASLGHLNLGTPHWPSGIGKNALTFASAARQQPRGPGRPGLQVPHVRASQPPKDGGRALSR